MAKFILFIFSSILIISCSNSSADEYKLSPELKAKAQAIKEQAINPNSGTDNAATKQSNHTQESSPIWVAEQIFKAANTGNTSIIKAICDPLTVLTGKAKDLCNIPTEPKNKQENFMAYFKLGKINGEPIIEGDKAIVKILIGYDGKAQETLNMTKREGYWFLTSF